MDASSHNKPIMVYDELLSDYKQKKKSLESARKWFPIYSSKEFAEIVAAIMTDGHIDFQLRQNRPKTCKVILYSNEKKECQWFLDLLDQLFQVKGKIIEYHASSGFSKNKSFKGIVNCSPLARLLYKIGVPRGDKTKSSYTIPDWIMNASREIKKAFLRVMFNFDGSLSLRNRGLSTMEMNFVTNKQKDYVQSGVIYIEQIKSLLAEFGIRAGKVHVRLHQKDKYTIMLFISNNDSVFNFYKNIGFINENKNLKLKTAVSLIRKFKRVKPAHYLSILNELKNKIGTDKETVLRINTISDAKYTYRQFEHMRRGEGLIPIDMINSVFTLLKKENERISRYD
jgi:hypothetical protein